MKKPFIHRRGYAMMMVMVFVVLFGAVLGVAWRRVSCALRIEHISEVRRQADRGSVQALAQAIKVLETRLRRDASAPANFILYLSDAGMTDLTNADILAGWQWKTCRWMDNANAYDISNDSYDPYVSDHPDSRWYVVSFSYNTTTAEWTIQVASQKNEPTTPPLMPKPL